ncbi:hypothetical protein VPNG_00597 [Cytospora leucostoma]|uniref:ABC transporter domain-containing protein n=1 Tax=Cytospora leucostoma TaxID=1230097 RepID=A0A423XMI0_9PEZI|nr:hypothetical protein VPNG_00597 [Cytospora leucostoma]
MHHIDVEKNAMAEAYLQNETIHNISWRGINVTVKDRESKQPKVIVDNVHGYVEAGELLALMGPSGCGKTTLLNVLASRPAGAATVDAKVLVNGAAPSRTAFRQMSRFVEQEDALIGSLTVRETLGFASRLASTGSLPRAERIARTDSLLESFGLGRQSDAIIGTPIRKGISGGQKRRVGIASQLITGPKVLFLDEPTSGLDSAASFEVISFLRGVARRNGLIVIASIHQPSTSTFNLFDKLLLLSGGRTHYYGPLRAVGAYYESIGKPVPLHTNPAEFLLDQVNIDFASDSNKAQCEVEGLHRAWLSSPLAEQLSNIVGHCETQQKEEGMDAATVAEKKPSFPSLVLTLLHRSFIKSYRDVIAYGVRMAMYLCLAIMMGTVWVRLKAEQEYIQPYINAIFFGSAFMSFMAVAYVPAFIEDRQQYVKEFHNGLYGAAELVISNFLIGTPYLFLIAISFSSISYFLSNFQPTGTAFFTWVMWVFLDLLAAESLVVLVSSIFPNFVIALALVAFANGLWMCVNGFMVQPTVLNVFYKYVFSYWDYQKYVFEGMMVNEFHGRAYSCGSSCQCLYQTELADQCKLAGQGVLDQYGFKPGNLGKNVGIMIGIIAGYRIAAWLALMWRR